MKAPQRKRPKPVRAQDVLENALSVKFNYVCHCADMVGMELDIDPADQAAIEENFTGFIIEHEPNDFSISYLKGLISEEWYQEFDRLSRLRLEWEIAAVTFSNIASENPYLLIQRPLSIDSPLKIRRILNEIKRAARDSGLTTLLGPKLALKILQDSMTNDLPLTEADMDVLPA